MKIVRAVFRIGNYLALAAACLPSLASQILVAEPTIRSFEARRSGVFASQPRRFWIRPLSPFGPFAPLGELRSW